MKQIAEGLWQDGVHWFDAGPPLPDVEVVIFASEYDHRMVPDGADGIEMPFPDDANGVSPTILEALRGLCAGVAHRRVLTVCSVGENRSGLLSALILMARGMSAEDAISTVQKNGPARTHDHALWNPGFLRQLRDLA